MAFRESGRRSAGSAGAEDLEAGSRSSNPSVQRQQKQQQEGGSGQAPGAPMGSSGSAPPPCQEDHTNQPRSLTRAVNEVLGDDTYAIFVGSMIAVFASTAPPAKGHRCRLYRLGSLVLFTVGLQLALIVLLWRAASNGTPSPEQFEKHMIWKQFGNVNKAVCQLRHASEEVFNVWLGSDPDRDQTCADFWPDNNTYIDIPDYHTAESCFSKPPWEVFDKDKNDTTCARALISLNSSMLAYGWGFFTNRTKVEPPSHLGLPWMKRGGFFLGGWDDNQFDDGDPFFCIACAYILLAIVVHREVKTAARLCFTATVAAGIVPEFYGLMPGPSCWRSRQPRMYRDLPKDELPRWVCAFILVAPLLQMLVALCVMATGGVMFVLQLGQSGSVQIIINSVALAFIVELDNYMGSLVAKGWRNSVVLQPAPAQPMPRLRRGERGWGVAYFAVVGMFLFIEVALLSPQSSATLLEFATVVLKGRTPPRSGFTYPGLKDQFMSNLTIRPGGWFDFNLWIVWAFGGWMDAGMYFRDPDQGLNQLTSFGTRADQQMAFLVFALVMYALASAVVVAFVFSRTIPSASRRWQRGLVVSQLLLTLVLQLQSSHFDPRCFGGQAMSIPTCRSRDWWWVVVLSVFMVAWAGMFVVWPVRCTRQGGQEAAADKACGPSSGSAAWHGQHTDSYAVVTTVLPAAVEEAVAAAAAGGAEQRAQERRPLPSQLTLEQRLEGAEARELRQQQLLEAAEGRLQELQLLLLLQLLASGKRQPQGRRRLGL